jgi:hypothetical protein
MAVAAFLPHYVRTRYGLHSALIALLVRLAYDLGDADGDDKGPPQ